MLFFKKKKQDLPLPEPPELPDFPEFPGLEKSITEIKKPSLKPIHENKEISSQHIEIPKRRPLKFPKLPKEDFEFPKYSTKDELAEIKSTIKPMKFEGPEIPIKREQPLRRFEPRQMQENKIDRSKPLYIQIEAYNDVQSTLHQIKTKLNESESLISNLLQLKSQEDQELKEWQSTIDKIKERLIDIDKKLFSEI